MALLTFEQALAASAAAPRRHLLLGNGFSIALRPDIFTYDALFHMADFSAVPNAEMIFEALDTKDFEIVIRLLVDVSKVLRAYDGIPPKFIAQLEHDADAIKSILVSAIAGRHPDRPHHIDDDQYRACRTFLSHFMDGKIYTLNYDVLLYWALMHDEVDERDVSCDDGFRAPEDDFDAPYVSWQEMNSPSVYYLHGALHLFDAGHELQKYTWARTDLPIIEQIRDALDADRFPLFVSEGTSRAKLTKIMHSAYLHKALRSFESVSGPLFIYGHSLAENDDHILNVIAHGKIQSLYVSIYGDPNSPANQEIMARAEALADRRRAIYRGRNALTVRFFQAESANVWG